MKTPKKIVIFGRALRLEMQTSHKKTIPQTGFSFSRENWAIGVTPDYKAIVLFKIIYEKGRKSDVKKEAGGTWHRIEKYKIESDNMKKAGVCVQINYSSERFEDMANRPDEYEHKFTGKPREMYIPEIYSNDPDHPTVFLIQYTPKRWIFSPGAKGREGWPGLEIGAGII